MKLKLIQWAATVLLNASQIPGSRFSHAKESVLQAEAKEQRGEITEEEKAKAPNDAGMVKFYIAAGILSALVPALHPSVSFFLIYTAWLLLDRSGLLKKKKKSTTVLYEAP